MTRRLHAAAAQLILACASVISGTTAQADVTTKHSLSVQGVGIMAAGNLSGTTTRTISGDRSRTDDDLQLKSKLVRMLAHGALGPSAEIVRLDTGRIYHLNINKKQYTELSLDEMRDRLNKALNQPAEEGQQKSPAPMDDSQCEWLEPKADVKKTGEKAQIAGYAADRVTITASQPCKDKKTGSICEVALGLDEWLAPGFTTSAEELKFERAYVQKLGLESSMQDVTQRAQRMFGRYKGIWTQVAAKMKDVKGYPVKTSFTFALGGAQCQNKQSASSDDDSSSPGDVTKEIGSKLGSLFHRKSDDEPAAAPTPASPPPIPPGTIPVVTVTSELLSVSNDAAPAGAFDVPADFKKVEQAPPKGSGQS